LKKRKREKRRRCVGGKGKILYVYKAQFIIYHRIIVESMYMYIMEKTPQLASKEGLQTLKKKTGRAGAGLRINLNYGI
jgi:hypothetical protein